MNYPALQSSADGPGGGAGCMRDHLLSQKPVICNACARSSVHLPVRRPASPARLCQLRVGLLVDSGCFCKCCCDWAMNDA
jgi:hypothetical protein